MSSSSAIRSSYSMPSAFIWATASPQAFFSCAARIWRGSSSVASITETIQRKGFRGRVKGFDGGQRERRQRLVEGEVSRQVDGQPVASAL